MPLEYQTKVWDLIDEWSRNASEDAKAALRERIRRFAFTRIGRRRNLKKQRAIAPAKLMTVSSP